MKRHIWINLLFIVCASSMASVSAAEPASSDWPRFRGPTGDGLSPAKGIPTTWSRDQNVLWKADLPRAFNPYSSPIVSGDKVFVATSTADPAGHKLLCFNLADGRLIWECAIPPGPEVMKDKRPGYNCPTPCTDGERVYVTFGSCALTAVDFQGKVVWQKPVEKEFSQTLATSPVLYKGLVIQVCDTSKTTPSSVMAFDRKTGDLKYQAVRTGANVSWGTPILVMLKDKTVLMHKTATGVQGIDPENGEVLWTANIKTSAMASPVYGAGLVYSDSGWGGDGVAVVVDAASAGDISKNVKWRLPGVKQAFGSPVIVDGTMYRFDAESKGTLRCVELATGKLVDTLALPGLSSWANPIATADGYVYLATGGRSYVVKTGLKAEIVGTNELDDYNIGPSPAVVDGKLIIRGANKLWCVGKP